MIFTAILNKEGISGLPLSASILIHTLIFFAVGFLINFFGEISPGGSAYIQLETSQIENIRNIKDPHAQDFTAAGETPLVQKVQKETREISGSPFADINNLSADTTQLIQIYKESSLNVRIKYPPGWTYIDQNVRNKLDGVTFWASAGNYNPPPYIHLEVKEKYLFNPERFKYKFKINGINAYFNDPEELAGQYSQVIYLRTDSDEDYSLKLIMTGRESFYSFQPMFFAMLKTFKFGRNFF